MITEKKTTPEPFRLTFTEPYTTFLDGEPKPIPYTIDGLLTQGGFSALGGKSKQGKSSLARYEAVCIAKGLPFLGRKTIKGEVILINLEDPIAHVDNCLNALGYDKERDARIQLVGKLAASVDENIYALREALTKHVNIRLVIIDTLAKFIRVKDLNEYMPVLTAVEKLHDLAREFPSVHIQGLAHAKKVQTEDPFDGLLGSMALRGEPDTNMALYLSGGQRIIAAETRIGRQIQPTLLKAELVTSAGADVVRDFHLDQSLEEWQASVKEKTVTKQKLTIEEKIIEHLKQCPEEKEHQEVLFKAVRRRRKDFFTSAAQLVEDGILIRSGKEHSSTNPLTLQINQDKEVLRLMDLGNRFGFASPAADGESHGDDVDARGFCFSLRKAA